MEYKSPVYNVIAVPIEKIQANTYNPNAVAPPEMKLLYESIKTDGYTMPIVCYYVKSQDIYVIIDVSTGTGSCWNIRIFMREKAGCCRYR